MDPLTLALLGGGAGLLKGLFVDGPQAEQQNKINAAVTRYSPWTGMKGDTTHHNPNTLGDMLTGGMAGAMLGQSGILNPAAAAESVALPGASPLSATNIWDRLSGSGMLGASGGGNYGMRGLSLLGGQ